MLLRLPVAVRLEGRGRAWRAAQLLPLSPRLVPDCEFPDCLAAGADLRSVPARDQSAVRAAARSDRRLHRRSALAGHLLQSSSEHHSSAEPSPNPAWPISLVWLVVVSRPHSTALRFQSAVRTAMSGRFSSAATRPHVSPAVPPDCHVAAGFLPATSAIRSSVPGGVRSGLRS